MGIIIHPRRWASQPPLGACINFGHPLARGLVFYVLYNRQGGSPAALLPFNLPGTNVGGIATPAWIGGHEGASSLNFGNIGSYWFERGAYCEPNWVSTVTRCRRSGNLSISAQVLCKTFHNNGSAPFISYAISHNAGTSNNDQFTSFFADQGSTLRVGSSITPGSGSLLKPYTVAMSVGPNGSSADLKTYFNGIRQATDNFASTSGIGYDTTSTGRLIVGGASSGSGVSPWNGEIYFSAVYNRALSDSEMQWLHVEPYALLVPMRRRRYFGKTLVVSGGGQPNVCVATF